MGSEHYLRIRQQIVHILSRLPAGRVTTYGDIGAALEVPPRHVAYILSRLDPLNSELLPWHRVVGAGGKIGRFAGRDEQIRRLSAENVSINHLGQVENWRQIRLPVLTDWVTGSTRPE